jgi:hypothetical protein
MKKNFAQLTLLLLTILALAMITALFSIGVSA